MPIYVLGKTDPVAVARSKRGIAGSTIMTTFDKHCLAGFMSQGFFTAKYDDIALTPMNPYSGMGAAATTLAMDQANAALQAANDAKTNLSATATQSEIDAADAAIATATANLEAATSAIGTASAGGLTQEQGGFVVPTTNSLGVRQTTFSSGALSSSAKPMFVDQLMPFDITLAAATEYNSNSHMRILGVEILNEGSGVSIDDTSNEVQMTYIARLITPWQSSVLNRNSFVGV